MKAHKYVSAAKLAANKNNAKKSAGQSVGKGSRRRMPSRTDSLHES